MRKLLSIIVICAAFTLSSLAQTQPAPAANKPAPSLCARCIRAHEEFLASDAMRGRGSGTREELITATYIAAQLRSYGIQPAGDNGGYVQAAPLLRRTITAAPTLEVTTGAAATWTYGKDFLIERLSKTDFSGPLQKVDTTKDVPKVKAGAVVLIAGLDPKQVRQAAYAAIEAGAAGIISTSPKSATDFEAAAKTLPRLPNQLESGASEMFNLNAISASPALVAALERLADGTEIKFHAPVTEEKGFTWNAVGKLEGTDPKLRNAAILLSAHLDHLGVGAPVNGDDIYNGADDDASGTTAVLELARVLGAGPRPRRTVIFALFGSEEQGGLGSTYFREHPPIPLTDIAANLEFEMIGRADPKVKTDTLWLTGWERSNLGPTLAAHGAKLVGDPHPDQNFFMRSDNYVLAKKGVVAQTVSSYGLHKDYHQPSDDLAHLDFKHMDAAIGSLLGPIEWLVNSSFTPQWNKGGRP